jgi:CheY-like chemotaxis protein
MPEQKKFDNILLIEDNEITASLISTLLKELGVFDRLYYANNGTDGLSQLEKLMSRSGDSENQENIIFLDLHMPEMNGVEFLGHFFEHPRYPVQWSVYILTTSSNYEDIEKVIQFPVRGYLVKPLTEEKVKGLQSEYFEKIS